jgi:hypothetical protein
MYTITTTNTISGNVVNRFHFVHFIEAYNSFISRCDEHGYDYEMNLDNGTWTGGGRGCDVTITMTEETFN